MKFVVSRIEEIRDSNKTKLVRVEAKGCNDNGITLPNDNSFAVISYNADPSEDIKVGQIIKFDLDKSRE